MASGAKTRPGVIVDFRDNVVYNLSGATNLGDAHINFINNFYRPGPNTPHGQPADRGQDRLARQAQGVS